MERGVSFLEVACAGSVEGYFAEVQGSGAQYCMFFLLIYDLVLTILIG